ncbi:MAG: bifunctional diaminohydroxyphosphoribosylaminopyrimidine deaminase/5-amino-6-(5-phosphoribosylamino)uracil reductase RibD [Pseudomonadota bacterium]
MELAERGRFSTAPNPCVGALIVRDGRVLGRGWHERAGGPHAEIAAFADARANLAADGLDAAAIESALRGSTVYVSLEPCAFEGRTPACADALIKAGVARVVGALTDPHPKVAGSGYERLRAAGISVTALELPEAEALNPGYLSQVRRGRPYLRVKIASSLDGRTAMASGESQWITSAPARADVQYWRARSDAVLTGAGTVRADDPQLNVRDERYRVSGILRQPLRAVLDTQGTLASGARMFADVDTALWLQGPDAATADHGVPVARCPHASEGGLDLAAALSHLTARGCNEVLLEAGPQLVGSVLAAGLWDELILYQAPKWLGSHARPQAELALERMAEAIEATIVDCTLIGPDLRLILRPQA